MNPIIVMALVVQWWIRSASPLGEAVAGFAITTGILFWGIAAYATGDAIALFGIPLSEPVFYGVCALWYVLDTRDFLRAQS